MGITGSEDERGEYCREQRGAENGDLRNIVFDRTGGEAEFGDEERDGEADSGKQSDAGEVGPT